jgi:hypothetical protein
MTKYISLVENKKVNNDFANSIKKRLIVFLFIVLLLIVFFKCYHTNDFVEELMLNMNIEEKCGQMTQITLDAITNCPPECSNIKPDGQL